MKAYRQEDEGCRNTDIEDQRRGSAVRNTVCRNRRTSKKKDTRRGDMEGGEKHIRMERKMKVNNDAWWSRGM